ncbi:MAG: PIN/TRAM domain-containing protein [Planctomycetota bacterium]
MNAQPPISFSPEAQEEQRQKQRIVQWLRALLLILLAVVTALGIVRQSETGEGVDLVGLWWAILVGVGAFFGVVIAIDWLTPRRKLSTISAFLVGTFAGVLATAMIGFVIDLFVVTYLDLPEGSATARQVGQLVLLAKVIIGLGLCYLGITTVLQTQDDFRLVIPYVEFSKRYRGPRPMLVDTSALIDGRVLGLAEAGLLQAPLVIPQFVIDELHRLSDSADRGKRARGRRGLEMVKRVQRAAEVTIDNTAAPEGGADQALVSVAASLPGSILTSDAGLASIAQIQNVAVISLVDLASALRPAVAPGATVTVEVVRRGDQPGQGVGFLDDGTMIVVEKGESLVGHHAEVVIKTSVRTGAGELFFARPSQSLDGPEDDPPSPPTPPPAAGPQDLATGAGDGSSASVGRRVPRPTGSSPGGRNPRRA